MQVHGAQEEEEEVTELKSKEDYAFFAINRFLDRIAQKLGVGRHGHLATYEHSFYAMIAEHDQKLAARLAAAEALIDEYGEATAHMRHDFSNCADCKAADPDLNICAKHLRWLDANDAIFAASTYWKQRSAELDKAKHAARGETS